MKGEKVIGTSSWLFLRILLVVRSGQEWVRDFLRPILGRDQTHLCAPDDYQSQSSGLASNLFGVIRLFSSFRSKIMTQHPPFRHQIQYEPRKTARIECLRKCAETVRCKITTKGAESSTKLDDTDIRARKEWCIYLV